ncbi:MAG: AAA family ATPase [Desulfuromonadales bacterium]
MLETLCRRTKRNPILVGPAGVGKTAVVENFAMMLASGDVPDFMKDSTVVLLQPSLVLAASRGQQGNLEKWMMAIISEASQDGIILFIDEVHTIVGAGGLAGTSDIASMMKPPLARGDMACIAATTDDEYRRFIESDTALERRFQPIRVQELNLTQTLQVLKVIRDGLSTSRGISVSDSVLDRLLDHANSFMRNRTFPDKAIDLLEQCVASALVNGATSIETSDADEVFSRITGTPLDLGKRLEILLKNLIERGGMSEDDAHAFLIRLQVTMSGLDLRTIRPNAVLLLADSAAQYATSIAEIISTALYDTPGRVITFDMGRISSAEECSLFFGAPPGYVGYSDTVPVHAIKQSPSSIVILQNVDCCNKQALLLIEQGIRDGFFLDGQARKVFLSDSIIILTAAGITAKSTHPVGFGSLDSLDPLDANRQNARNLLGEVCMDLVDLICTSSPVMTQQGSVWIRNTLLSDLADRYRRLGIDVTWDDSLVRWLANEYISQPCENHLERIADEQITPTVMRYSNNDFKDRKKVTIFYSEKVDLK